MARVERITDLIGKTPLVRIGRMNDGKAVVYGKWKASIPFRA